MADAPTTSAAPNASSFSIAAFGKSLMRTDIVFALGVMAIIVMLILPLPTWMLDFALALSISFSVLVLMTALFIKGPLEFTAFPTVLLVATMFRLGLNIASTRLILANGNEGERAAGDVIAAFGSFVMQGNFVIGIIVFSILVIVNFVVITKGSGRIAEVAARFTLDAMPGKQMAVDADLSSGLINEEEAKQRRKDLEAESNFFGAMDGASKFVRGDAMAGLMITCINVIAGIIIGVAQHQMSFGDAADAYTRLTVGDGLVSQIPALVISIAAGMLVSKAGVEGAADEAFVGQLTGYPQGLAMVSGVCVVTGVLPGMPALPFFALGAAAGYGAWRLHKKMKAAPLIEEAEAAAAAEAAEPAEPPIAASLAIDELKIELGYGLLALINEMDGRKLTDQIKALRRNLAAEYGFVTPSVRLLDNLKLAQEGYLLRVKEIDAGQGEVRLRGLLAMDPAGGQVQLAGEHVKEPAFGLPAAWIDENLREEATFRGYTVVDPATVLVTHFTEVVKEHMADLLSFAQTERLLSELGPEHQKLLDDICPSQITRSGIQRILQALLRERVSIRDLGAILEGVAEGASLTRDLVQIVEHVRARLARQLCSANQGPDGSLPVVTLSPQWEQAFAEAIVGEGENRQLALAPSQLHDFVQAVRNAFETAARAGDMPVLLTSPLARPFVRGLAERFRPATVVMSQNEIHPKARLKQAGQV